jgi:hypothetical protein
MCERFSWERSVAWHLALFERLARGERAPAVAAAPA